MVKRFKSLMILLTLVLGITALSAGFASAATVTNATINVSIVNEAGVAVTGAALDGLNGANYLKLTDLAGTLITTGTINTNTGTGSVIAVKEGAYRVIASGSVINLETEVKITANGAKAVKLVYISKSTTSTKIGAAGGFVGQGVGSSTPATNSLVKLVSNSQAWVTRTDGNGLFRVLLPSGKYKLIVFGTGGNNQYFNVAVVAGQVSSPLAALKIDGSAVNLGFAITNVTKLGATTDTAVATASAIPFDASVIKGTAITDSIVSLYEVNGDGTVNLLATTKPIGGKYSLKLPGIAAGKTLRIVVRDLADNNISATATIGTGTLTFTAPAANANYDSDYMLSLTGSTINVLSLMNNTNTTVYVSGAAISTLDYSLSAGKLTLKKTLYGKGTLVMGTNTIKLSNAITTDASLTITVGPATTLAKTVTVAVPTASTTATSATLLLATKVVTTDTIGYFVTNATVAAPKYMSTKPAGLTNLAVQSGTSKTATGDVIQVSSTNKYIAIYEYDASGYVVGFKLVTLTAAQISVPKLSGAPVPAAVVSDSTITINFNQNINYATGIDAAKLKLALKITNDGTTYTSLASGDTVVVTGSTIVITLKNVTLTGTSHKVKIPANQIQDVLGNKVAAELLTTTF